MWSRISNFFTSGSNSKESSSEAKNDDVSQDEIRAKHQIRSQKVDEENQIHLKKFSLDSIPSSSMVVVIGQRDSGKHWLVRDMLHHLKQKEISSGTIFSAKERYCPFYSEYIPSDSIKYEIEDETLHNTLEEYSKQKGNGSVIVIDEETLGSKPEVWRWSSIRKLFLEGRCHKVHTMITMQYPMPMPPMLRQNIDYVFLFHTDDRHAQMKLYDNYAGMFPSFSMFKQVLERCTEDFNCLVIDLTSRSKNLTDRIFYYKARDFENKMLWG